MPQANVLKEEGLSLFQQGSRQQALVKLEEAAQAYAQTNDPVGQGETMNNIGVIHQLQGNYEAAVSTLLQAEAIFVQAGDANRQGQALGNMGDAYAAWGKRDEAARAYSNASALLAQSNDFARQSQVLRALSLLSLRRGRWMAAMMHMEESLRVRPRLSLGQRLFRGMLRFVLGMVGSA